MSLVVRPPAEKGPNSPSAKPLDAPLVRRHLVRQKHLALDLAHAAVAAVGDAERDAGDAEGHEDAVREVLARELVGLSRVLAVVHDVHFGRRA